jgi:hypothetical protein
MAADTKIAAWRVEKGERETLTFPVLDAGGDPFPIDGWTVVATVRDRPDGTLLYTFPAGQAVVNSDENTVDLLVPAPVSALWTWWIGWYSVFIHDPATDPDDPAIYRVLAGPLIVDPA